MIKEAVVYFGIDIAKGVDQTAYWLYCDGQVKQISEEEYWKLLYERRIFSETTRQEYAN